MPKIYMTVSRIDRGVARFLRLVDRLDPDEVGHLTDDQIRRFTGRGKAMLARLHRYAAYIDGREDRPLGQVDRQAMRVGVTRLGNALKHIARTKGDKDGALSGTSAELGAASRSAQSLARWIHANVM